MSVFFDGFFCNVSVYCVSWGRCCVECFDEFKIKC